METRPLGSSEMRTSVFGLGCWPMGGGPGWGDHDEKEIIATVHAALDRGVNFFDSAEGYNDGKSEEVLGKALVGHRHSALIATKISPGNAEPETLRAHCEASLRRLRTDVIDLYQVHWPVAAPSVDGAFAALADLRDEGKVRAVAVSNHGVKQLTHVLATGASIPSNQVSYSLLSRAIETDIAPFCRQHGISIIAYMPLMQGLLVGHWRSLGDVPPFRARTRHYAGSRPEARHGEPGAEKEMLTALARIREIAGDVGAPMAHVALAWVAGKPGVASVLVGGRRPNQLVRNLEAASLRLLPDVVAELDRATEALNTKLGPSADYFQSTAKGRTA